MLILGRRKGQGLKIMIEGTAIEIEIKILKIQQSTVRLGIAAPRDQVRIIREELNNSQTLNPIIPVLTDYN
jgi:carbon storage regulator CsrA